MSFNNKNIDGGLPKLEVHPANEIASDPNHIWHAIRGYDFAGLESMLVSGISPAENQQDYSVCLSASPTVSHSNNREANSFYAYTLQDGLSLSITTLSVTVPSGIHGGFVDEIRRSSVSAQEIDGVMMPSHAVNQRLLDVSTVHEIRKPIQSIAYIERTLHHLSDLGAEVDTLTLELAASAIEINRTNDILAREDSQRLESAFMSAYSSFLVTQHGIEEPTVSDMLSVVLSRVHRDSNLEVYAYDEAIKKEVGRKNAQIVAKSTRAHNIGSTSLSSWH